MKTGKRITSLLLACIALAGAATATAGETSTATVQFSDPSKPGTLKLNLMLGDIRVVGADTKEITVRADAPLDNDGKPRRDGLRSIGGGGAFRVAEKDNVVSIDTGEMHGWHAPASFEITVPRSTSVVVKTMHGGETTVSNISGDVEVTNQNGDVRLDGLSGGVAVDTMNGEIKATFANLSESKAYSFASMNGEISILVPSKTKASLRFRAQLGEILTDFNEKELVTKVGPSVVVESGNQSNVPDVAPTPEVPAVPRVDSSGDRTPKPPKAPKAPRPTFGSPFGQVVTGTLNGGGPEIIATTMRGTITFRKSD